MFHLRHNELPKSSLRCHEIDEQNQTILIWTAFQISGSDSDENVASFNCLWHSSDTNEINMWTLSASVFIPEQENVESKLNEIMLEK